VKPVNVSPALALALAGVINGRESTVNIVLDGSTYLG